MAGNNISNAIRKSKRHDAVRLTVQLFENAILEHFRSGDRRPDVWITIVSEIVHRYGRPQATGSENSTPSVPMSERSAAEILSDGGGLFPEMSRPVAPSVIRAGEEVAEKPARTAELSRAPRRRLPRSDRHSAQPLNLSLRREDVTLTISLAKPSSDETRRAIHRRTSADRAQGPRHNQRPSSCGTAKAFG